MKEILVLTILTLSTISFYTTLNIVVFAQNQDGLNEQMPVELESITNAEIVEENVPFASKTDCVSVINYGSLTGKINDEDYLKLQKLCFNEKFEQAAQELQSKF